MTTYRLLTRNSRLALWQAEHVKQALLQLPTAKSIEVVGMTTDGDQSTADRLAMVGGKGLFIGNLEQAMLCGIGDFAVHSLKDVPIALDNSFCLAAILARTTVEDAFISNQFASLAALPRGARVGTSSLRRMGQLLAYRPDLTVLPLRGNLDTRLRKLDNREYDAIILAYAGMERLGCADRVQQLLPLDVMLPAVGQAALALEALRTSDIVTVLTQLTCQTASLCARTERAFARALAVDCSAPVAAYATISGEQITLRARIIAHDGTHMSETTDKAHQDEIETMGEVVAQKLLRDGGARLLSNSRAYITGC